MHSFAVTHESRNSKQARPQGQYVDLLRKALATPSLKINAVILSYRTKNVNT